MSIRSLTCGDRTEELSPVPVERFRSHGRVLMTLTGLLVIAVGIAMCERASNAAPAPELTIDVAASPYVPQGYELIWSDEFDGTALDESKWVHRGQGGPRRGGIASPDSSFLDGEGHLIIESRKAGDEYHSGMISTQKSFKVAYGYFEARMKFPSRGGKTSAFWLQAPGNSGDSGPPESFGLEIDVVVFYRGRLGGRTTNGLHWGGYGDQHQIKNHRTHFSDGGDWHTFGLLWTDKRYVFYRDGKETWQTSEPISHVPEYMIFSTAIGQKPKARESASAPDRLMVDYVRVYSATDTGAPEEDDR